MGWLVSLLTGPLVGAIADVFKSIQARKMTEAEAEAEIRKAIMATLAQVATQQANVIMAEARGESWLQRNWRPMVAVAFATIPFFYGIILPIAVDWFGMPPVRVGDVLLGWIMQAVLIALGGYIGGRSLEKIVGTWRR